MEYACLADPIMQPQFFSDERGLVIFRLPLPDAQDFLKGDDVSFDLPKDLRDSFDLNSPIEPTAFMDIVCDDS